MAEEEAIKASSTRPAAAAGSASGSSTKPMVDKKATANPANMTVRKSTPNASSSSLVSGPNSTKPRPLSSSNKSQLASSASAGGALNAPKSQARPPPPTQKPPSLQKAATTFLENDKATSNRTNRTQKSMSNAVAGGGGVAKQQTQASASQQSSHPRGLEVSSRCTPKMVPQANPRTSNMVPSAKTKEKQQSKKDQTSSSGGDNNPQRKLQQHQTIGNSNKERFHRQRSFVLNVPNEEAAERKSPRFKRSRTQSCMLPPSKEAVSFAARKRASNSTSEQHDNRQLNPQAKEFVMNRELPGVSDEVANCFSDQERVILFDALQTTSQHQPSNAVTRSKVKSLIEGADVILKAVLRGSLTNINASIVVTKIVEIDTTETFIESLMNCCKEHHSTITSRDKGPARESSSTHAFLTFLGDLYQLLRGSVKSHRHYQKEELNPCLFLLTLLSEWCQQTLLDMSQGLTKAFQEVDMLSKILPLVGRDERHLLMVGTTTQLMHLLRDAFLWNLTLEEGEEGKVTRHKLLHLIELQSGDWQLSSSALLYYNPTMNNSPLGNEIQVI